MNGIILPSEKSSENKNMGITQNCSYRQIVFKTLKN